MNPAIIHHLYYSWTGWPEKDSEFIPPDETLLLELAPLWANDGFSLVSYSAQSGQMQITCRVEPGVSPHLYATRIKGRLQYALRTRGLPHAFSRKLGVRALGHSPREVVARYVADQVKASDLADADCRKTLEDARFENAAVDLLTPLETDRGRYWYALHLVLVTEGRFRLGAQTALPALRDAVLASLTKLSCPVHSLSLLPDHLHVLLKAAPALSPGEIGLTVHGESNQVLGCRAWQDSVYLATVGEYSVNILPGAFASPRDKPVGAP
jgi:REP element-mobilizing transposase RayT